MVDKNQLTVVAAGINPDDYDCEYLGLRVTAPGYDCYDAQVGDVLPPSRVWVDGDYTDDELSGTSCIGLDRVARMPGSNYGYFGDRVLLIGGNHVEYGEDDGERIIRDATVLAIFKVGQNG